MAGKHINPIADVPSFVTVLRRRAEQQPGRRLFSFVADGDGDGEGEGEAEIHLSAGELDRRARAVAAELQGLGLANQRALLLYPPGLDFLTAFFGCLYAGVVAVPAHLPRVNRPMPRLRAIVDDARPLVVMTSASQRANARRWGAGVPELDGLHELFTDEVDEGRAGHWCEPEIGPDALAFLQYTSGSTATPRGVMISHANLLHNSALIHASFGSHKGSRGVSWLPLFHDMGLIGGVLQSIYCGGSSTLFSPVSFLQHPVRWLQAISRTGAMISGGPNFAYDLCVRKITPEQKAGLDLSCWQVAFNGAEPIRSETLERFTEAFAPCGFRREAFLPCYGLAEATLLVSGGPPRSGATTISLRGSEIERGRVVPSVAGEAGSRSLVGCGRVSSDLEIVIVDPSAGTSCPDDRVGEVWVSGPSVAQGYWNQPEATERTFRADPDPDPAGSSSGRFLRTGDLGFVHDGELFVTGRLKDLIIIRGRNVYPQDVEWTVERCHPALRIAGASAFGVDVDGEERLVVACEVERMGNGDSRDEAIAAIRRAVAEQHELEVHAVRLLRPMSLPKTSSGKVRRHTCREEFLAGTLEVVAGWTRSAIANAPARVFAPRESLRDVPSAERREALIQYLRERVAVALRVVPTSLELEKPLDSLGLDSLLTFELKGTIESDLGIVLPLRCFLEGPTIAQLADQALDQLSRPAPPRAVTPLTLEPEAKPSPSIAQEALWYAHQLATTREAYNISGGVRVQSEVDPEAFGRALRRLVERHEALRTTFPAVDGRPVLRVEAEAEPCLIVEDASAWSVATLERRISEEAGRPFDLERGPLHRVYLWTRSPRDHIVLLILHHILADFWTIAILVEEFGRLYAADRSGVDAGLEPLSLRYTDYVRWQDAMLAGPEGERLWSYWQSQLAGPLPDLDLPTDRPRPALPSGRGAMRYLELDEGLTRDLVAFSERRKASLHTCLLAGFQATLARLGGQEDVVVGSCVAGRTRPGLEGLVGYFVNIVPMRADLSGNPTFEALVSRVRRVVHEGLENQDFPYPLMVRRLPQSRNPGQPPIVRVVFIYQKARRLDDQGLSPFALSAAGHRMELGGLSMESLALHTEGSPFDITLLAAMGDGRLSLAVEYSADLFDPATIDRMLDSYRALLEAGVTDPGRRLADLPLLDEAGRQRLLVDWASGPGAVRVPDDVAVHHLFEDQARRVPGAIALVYGDDRLSYGELNTRANQVAHHLRGVGVGPGRLVGLCSGRSPALMVGLLGILKAGGAYVPLDPTLPKDRLDFLWEDSGVAVVVTDGRSEVVTARAGTVVVDLLADAGTIDACPRTDPAPLTTPNDLAYVIYTSGSTGTPKGVIVTHANLINAYRAWEQAYDLSAWAGRHLQVAGAAFDVFTGDWTRALCSGGRLVSCPREALFEPADLYDLLVREGIDCAEFVPAGVEGLVEHLERTGGSLAFMRLIAVGSDLLHAGRYRRLRRLGGPRTRVINSYGLTEATIDSTYFEGDVEDDAADRTVPIGRPFAGSWACVLDGRLQPLPVGMTGELYIGGAGVALGYLNRPALTADRFVPDPFAGQPGARMYRTGDLARWRSDGTLELLGRADRQVKVRGYRIELGEIESALLHHPSVREAAVVVSEGDAGERRLSAFVVPAIDPAPRAADLRRWLKRGLPEYMVPSSLQVLPAMPTSTNGKLDRRALAALEPPPLPPATAVTDEPAAGDANAPRTPAEQILARIAAEVVGLNGIGIHDDLFEIGIDSVGIIRIVSRARQAGLDLTPAQVFRHPNIAELAAAVASAPTAIEEPSPADLLDHGTLVRLRKGSPAIEDAYPLSPVQEGMLFHTLSAPDSGVYVEQFSVRLRGVIDLSALEISWQFLVARHPALRTAMSWADPDRPVQMVFRAVELPLTRHDWRDLTADEQADRLESFVREDRARGFVPTVAPLLRIAAIRLEDDAYQLLWSFHHAAIDGWCVPLLFKELLDVYDALGSGRAPDLPPSRPFRDYIAWLGRQDPTRAESYWRRELAGFVAPTPLEIDPATTGAGSETAPGSHAEREAWLSAGSTEGLLTLARTRQLTLGTIVQGAWAILLGRYSGRDDIVFGLTVSGRPAELAGVESMVGMFINTLPMRVSIDEQADLVPWLRMIQGRQVELSRFEHSPLVQVQGWSDVPRGRPLFESIVVVENFPVDAALAGRADRLGVEAVRSFDQTNYPLDLTVVPGEQLWIKVGYDPGRFDAGAIERLLVHLRTLLDEMAADPERCLADLPLLTEAERDRVVREWNETRADLAEVGVVPLPADLDRLPEEEVEHWIEHLRSIGGELR